MVQMNAIDAVDAASLTIDRLDIVAMLLQDIEEWLYNTSKRMEKNAIFNLTSKEPELAAMAAGDEIILMKETMNRLLDKAEAARKAESER